MSDMVSSDVHVLIGYFLSCGTAKGNHLPDGSDKPIRGIAPCHPDLDIVMAFVEFVVIADTGYDPSFFVDLESYIDPRAVHIP